MEPIKNPYQSPLTSGGDSEVTSPTKWRFAPLAACVGLSGFNLFGMVVVTLEEVVGAKYRPPPDIWTAATFGFYALFGVCSLAAIRGWRRANYAIAVALTLLGTIPLIVVVARALSR